MEDSNSGWYVTKNSVYKEQGITIYDIYDILNIQINKMN